jgi:hypothetical protein
VNLSFGRFIALTDPIVHIGSPYHLAQAIPERLRASDHNPYHTLTICPAN